MKMAKDFVPDDFIPDPQESPKPPALQKPKGHTPPSLTEQAPEPGFLLPGRQATYHRNQVEDFKAKEALIIAQESHSSTMEMNARAIDHNLTEQPKRLAQETE